MHAGLQASPRLQIVLQVVLPYVTPVTRPNPSLCASSKFIFKYNFFILAETKSIMYRLEKG